MKLKAFKYNYFINYGNGCGVVFAKTKGDAIKMIEMRRPHAQDLEVEEIDISKPIVIDHSWEE